MVGRISSDTALPEGHQYSEEAQLGYLLSFSRAKKKLISMM